MAKRTCNICMDDSSELNYASWAYVCTTCESGYVCRECIPEFDPRGSVFLNTKKKVEKTIKCPCCRQLNWKYQFNQIIQISFKHDLFDYEPDSPVAMLYIRNADL